ncbi:MAG: hypothetical protein ABIQ99_13490 [Thermoflexales bacterium]
MDDLAGFIRAWSIRARWQHGLRWVFAGLACGLGIPLALAIAARFAPLISLPRLIAISILAASSGVFVALALPWVRGARRSTLSWAREFDHRLSLKERLSTALEARDGTLDVRNDAIRRLQSADALDRAGGVDAARALPLRVSRRDAAIAAVIGLGLVLALALPNPQQTVLALREQFQEAARAEAAKIAEVEKAIENSPFLSETQKQSALDALEQARRSLEDANATPEQALAALNEAEARLNALQNDANPAAREDLRRAGQIMTPDELTRQMAESLAQGEFQKAAEQMRQLTSKNGQALSEAEQNRLANQLDQMAREVQNSDPQLSSQLRQAAQDLRQGKAETAQQQLSQAADSLDRSNQAEASENALESAEQSAAEARQRVAEAAGQSANGAQSQPGKASGSAGAPSGPQGEPGTGQGGEPTQAQGGQPSASGPGDSNTPGHSEDTGTDNSVYAPGSRLNPTGSNVVLPESQSRTSPDPNSNPRQALPGNSIVPYQQVYREYAKTADQALQTGDVPAALRDYIRDYFSSLDPKR